MDEGHRMSNYGLKDRNPAETTGQWKEVIKRETRIDKNHLAIKGNGTEVWPGVVSLAEQNTEPQSFFNNVKEHDQSSIYDRMFHIQYDYNSKLHRDDRQHTVGLDIQSEEYKRVVPVRSSSEYGRRVDSLHEATLREHVRIDKVMKGFYRSRGTGIPTSMDKKGNTAL